ETGWGSWSRRPVWSPLRVSAAAAESRPPSRCRPDDLRAAWPMPRVSLPVWSHLRSAALLADQLAHKGVRQPPLVALVAPTPFEDEQVVDRERAQRPRQIDPGLDRNT